MKKEPVKSDWLNIPPADFQQWFAEWVLSSMALKFYGKNGRFPTAFRSESIKVKGRNLSMELI